MDTLNLDELSKKMDILMNKVDELSKKMEFNGSNQVKDQDTTTITLEYYKEAVLIKFSYNELLKNFIKEQGGKWFVSKKAWMFPKSNEKEIVEKIKESFSEYTFN